MNLLFIFSRRATKSSASRIKTFNYSMATAVSLFAIGAAIIASS